MGGPRESGGARHNWGFTRMLQSGILERLVSPPATPKGEEGHDRELTTPAGWSGLSSAAVSGQDPPMSLAATVEPTMAERLGAMRDMRLSTYLSMCSLASLRVSIISHASNTRSTSSCSTFCLGGGREGRGWRTTAFASTSSGPMPTLGWLMLLPRQPSL